MVDHRFFFRQRLPRAMIGPVSHPGASITRNECHPEPSPRREQPGNAVASERNLSCDVPPGEFSTFFHIAGCCPLIRKSVPKTAAFRTGIGLIDSGDPEMAGAHHPAACQFPSFDFITEFGDDSLQTMAIDGAITRIAGLACLAIELEMTGLVQPNRRRSFPSFARPASIPLWMTLGAMRLWGDKLFGKPAVRSEDLSLGWRHCP